MADKNLEIQVKLTADTAGAQQAAAELKKLTDAATAATTPAAAPKQQEATKATEEATKAVEEQKKATEETTKAIEKETVAIDKKADEQKKEIKVVQESTAAEKEKAKATEKATAEQKEAVKVIETSAKTVGKTAQDFDGIGKASGKATTAIGGTASVLAEVANQASGGSEKINVAGNTVSMLAGAIGGGLVGALDAVLKIIGMVIDYFDLFGEKAKKAREEAAALAQEMMAKADAAYLDAKASEAAAKAQEEYNSVLQLAENRYKAVLAQAEAVTRQKKEMADAEIASADAEAALSMAQLQLAEARGEVSKEDAIRAREKIRTEAEARKFTAETAAEEAKIAETRKKAAAEEELANNKANTSSKLREKSFDLLSENMAKAKEAAAGSIKAEMERSRLLQAEEAKKGVLSTGLKQEQAKYAQMQEALLKLEGQLEKNKDLQNETGFKTFEEARDAAKKLEEESQQSRGDASKLRQQAESGEFGLRSRGAVFQTRQIASATTAQAEIETEQARQAESARREEEKKAQDEERAAARMAKEREQVGTAGGRLASALQGGGASSAFVGQLQSAVAQTAAGGSSEQLMQLMQTLMANLSKMDAATREKLQKLQAEVNDLAVAK